jgi:DNA-binding XRE family transcriptional regulator
MTGDTSRKKVRATGAQIAGAREYLRMTQGELAQLAGTSRVTLVSFENGLRTPYESTREKLQSALEARGIVFTNGNRPGFYFDKEKAASPT